MKIIYIYFYKVIAVNNSAMFITKNKSPGAFLSSAYLKLHTIAIRVKTVPMIPKMIKEI